MWIRRARSPHTTQPASSAWWAAGARARRSLRALGAAALVVAAALVLLGGPRFAAAPAAAGLAERGQELRQQLLALRPEPSPAALVERAMLRVERAGSYRLLTDAEQRMLPRGVHRLAGQSDRRADLRIEGVMAHPDRARLDLTVEGAGAAGAVTLLRQGAESFVEVEGRLQAVQGPASPGAPTADPLGFLAASRDHAWVAEPAEPGLRRLRFTVDGPGFARHVQAQLQEAMASDLPPGGSVAAPTGLAGLTGEGEVWIDERDYPVRIELELFLPEVDEQFDARVRMVSSLSGFGEPVSIPTVLPQGEGFVYGPAQTASAGKPALDPSLLLGWLGAALAGFSLAALVVLAAYLVLFDARRRRRAYGAVVGAAILSLLGGPYLSAHRHRAFAQVLQEAAERPGLAEAFGHEPPSALDEALEQRSFQEGEIPPEQIHRCGEGAQDEDTDGEGLSDYVEGCLGTNPIDVDTDGDLLNDRLEVEGIEDAEGRVWTSDPLRPDSNNDGLHDKEEWPESHGFAPSLDADGDGLPNMWDPDNDGDGVRDGEDISPFSHTVYDEAFALDTFRPAETVTNAERTQFVFIHVQPEDEAHLRYSLTPLDWSYDDRGQIQVLSAKDRELRLSPMLSIDTTISPTLAADQGVSVQVNGEEALYPYTLLLPLAPVGQNGRIEALGGMLGYTPDELSQVVWSMRMVWAFTGTIDQGKSCDDAGRHCRSFDSRRSTLVVYPEDRFRISGLSVQLSSDNAIAALSTPQQKAEDYDLIQAFAGLNETFLSSARPDEDPDAPAYHTLEGALEALTEGGPEERFGISTTIEAVGGGIARYENSLDAWQEFGGRTESFLNARYERCLDQSAGCEPDQPTLLYVTEMDSGVYNLDDMAAARAEEDDYSATLDVLEAIDVDQIRVATLRGTRLQMYEWRANRWAPLSLEQTLDAQEARYPDLDPSALALMRLSYAAWTAGVDAPVRLDGQPLDQSFRYEDVVAAIAAVSGDAQSAGKWFGALADLGRAEVIAGLAPAQGYAALAYGLHLTFSIVAGLIGLMAVAFQLVDLAKDSDQFADTILGLDIASKVFAVLAKMALVVKHAIVLVRTHGGLLKGLEWGLGKLIEGFKAVGDLLKGTTPAVTSQLSQASNAAKAASKAAKWAPIIGLVIGIAVAVTVYFLTISQNWGSSLLHGYAAAQLIASIVIVVILYLISTIPVFGAIIVLVILVIWALVYLITLAVTGEGFDIIEWLTGYLANLIFQAAQVTDVYRPRIGEVRSELADPELGPVAGNTLRVWADFQGNIVSKRDYVIQYYFFVIPVKVYYQGTEKEKKRSHIYADWTLRGPGGSQGDARVDAMAIPAEDRPEGWKERGCAYISAQNRCSNSLGADYRFLDSGANRVLKALTIYDWKLAFKEVILAGTIPIRTAYEKGVSPDPDATKGEAKKAFEKAWREDAVEVHFDVLPADLDELWTWADREPLVKNRDRDADGLDNDEERSETGPGTDWLSWDTDGDGLSDGYEIQGRTALSETVFGPDPALFSTDGDALGDGYELEVTGTAVNDEDTDGDGLLDHEEACVDGRAAWTVRILTVTARICGNPNRADSDGDELTDAQERAAGTSPFAFDQKRPALRIDTSPMLAGPNGQEGVFVRSGAEAVLTMTLRNSVANQATGDVSFCVGEGLGALRPLEREADASVPGGCPDGSHRLGYELPTLEGAELQSAYAGLASGGDSRTVTIHASLPFDNDQLDPPVEGATVAQRAGLVIDNEAPRVSISEPALLLDYEPALPAALRGERFVLAGGARDRWSWVDRVAVEARSQSALDASWVFTRTGETGRWSAAWDLPADGRYTIGARAWDVVGNASATERREVLVDNEPPVVSIELEDGGWLPDLELGPRGLVTASIPLRAEDGLSGIDLLQASLDGRPYQRVALGSEEAFPLEASVDFAWVLPGLSAQGSHDLRIRAIDRAGNVSAEETRSFVLDLTPPLSIQSNHRPVVPAGRPMALLGHADDSALLPPKAFPRPLQGPLDALDDATVWQAFPEEAGEVHAAWAGDLDGDGRSDLILGLPEHDADGDGAPEGRLLMVRGRSGGWRLPPRAELLGEAMASFVGAPGAGIGRALAPAGDVDGDGLDDVLVGDPANDRVLLLFGGGVETLDGETLDGAGFRRLVIAGAGAGAGTLGTGVASAGDVNADGLADLLLLETGDRGRAHLVLGAPGLRGLELAVDRVAARSFPMPAGGAPAIGAGDLDGDGYGDLALADPVGELPVSGGAPAIHLVRGARYPTQTVPMSLPLGGAAPLGALLAAAGDADGDGLGDLAYGSGDGARLALGGADLGALETRSLGVSASELSYLAGVGDVDPSETKGEGYRLDDLVLGTTEGSALLIRGASPFPDDPLPSAEIARAIGVGASPYPGASDANCDGSADLLLLPPTDALDEDAALSSAGPGLWLSPDALRASGARAARLAAPVLAADSDSGAGPGGLDLLALPGLRAFRSLRASAQTEDEVVRVSPRYCASCANDGLVWGRTAFARVSEALETGAADLRLDTGVYEESVRLGAGQRLRGVGAGVTILQAPAGLDPDGALVTIDGDGAALSGLALVGRPAEAGSDLRIHGLRVVGGDGILVSRLLVRHARDAIRLEGADTVARISGVTLVHNERALASEGCAEVDLRSSILAYNETGAAWAESGCASSPRRLRYTGFWANPRDLVVDGTLRDPADVGAGQVPADPRFRNPSAQDYRLQAGSPMIDAGQPGDPVPPGAGERADLGYAEHGAAVTNAGADYCATCDNDGLEWQVTAFDTIEDALDAAQRLRVGAECASRSIASGACAPVLSVGVAEGTYPERLDLPGHLRLLGSGADRTVIDGGLGAGALGSTLTLDGRRHVLVEGFTVRGFGGASGSAGVRLTGATSAVTLSRNLIVGDFLRRSDAATGVLVEGLASGLLRKNTIADVAIAVQARGAGAMSMLDSNLLYDYQSGIVLAEQARARSGHNLLYSSVSGAQDYAFVADRLVRGDGDLTGRDPLLLGGGASPYHLRAGSPAIGAGNPELEPGAGSGDRVSIGYAERLVAPASLLFGEEGERSCQDGASGVERVRVGLSRVDAPSETVEVTIPETWTEVSLADEGGTGRYWQQELPLPAQEGRYRLYAETRDRSGNASVQQVSELLLDASEPEIAWVEPIADRGDLGASVRVVASVTDVVRALGVARFSVAEVGFLIDEGQDGERILPGSWLDEAWSVADGRARSFFADLPLREGEQQVLAFARNEAGLEARTPSLRLEAVGSDVATLIAPADGGAFSGDRVLFHGFARLADAGQRDIRLRHQGQTIGQTSLPGEGLLASFALPVDLPPGDELSLRVLVGDATEGQVDPIVLHRDDSPPSLEVDPRQRSGPEVLGYRFTGRASDDGGPPLVELSLDGGLAWLPAATESLQGQERSWALDWVAPGGSDGIQVSALVRARDDAGNETVEELVVPFDNVAPESPLMRSIQPPEGSYTERSFTLLTLRWANPVLDGSGPAIVDYALVQDSAALPDEAAWEPAQSGCDTTGTDWTCELRQPLSSTGSYTMFLRSRDLAGNSNVTSYGPFHVGSAPPFAAEGAPLVWAPRPPVWEKAIRVDGRIEDQRGEWRAAHERLDDDERDGGVESLWTSWDADHLYLAWRGARWGETRRLQIYLDTGPGGTTQPLRQPEDGLPVEARLPQAADLLVLLEGEGSQGTRLLQAEGQGWRELDPSAFDLARASDPRRGETELRLGLGADVQAGRGLGLFALASEPGRGVVAALPTSNPLVGPWEDAYRWDALRPGLAPSQAQPGEDSFRLKLGARIGDLTPVGPGKVVPYRLVVYNEETEALPVDRLELRSNEGGDLVSQVGADCRDCPNGGRLWWLAIPEIPAGGFQIVDFDVLVPQRFAGIPFAEVEARILSEGQVIASYDVRKPIDSLGPDVWVTEPLAGTMRSGSGTVRGGTKDEGVGVAFVELREYPDGPWRRALGTRAWSIPVDMPAGERLTLQARATDPYGQSQISAPLEILADDVAPIASLEMPPVVYGSPVLVRGSVRDPFPENGPIGEVQVQVDDGDWQPGEVSQLGEDGHRWSWLWPVGLERQGRHELRVRARDAAGNWSEPTAPQEIELQPLQEADLEVRLDATYELPLEGTRVSLEVRSRNLGPLPAEDVVLVTGIPGGAELVALPPGCERQGRDLRCGQGTIQPGEETVIRFQVDVSSGLRASLMRHYAYIRSRATADGDPGNNRAQLLLGTGQPRGRPLYFPVVEGGP